MINPGRIARDVIVLGASAGGIQALKLVLKRLPPDLPAVIAIVIHRSPVFASILDRILGRSTLLPVSEPANDEAIERGRIYLAPRDHHLRIVGGRWRLTRDARIHHTRPAVDPLFVSAAESYGPRVVGIVLTGGGSDGVRGLLAIKQRGGVSIAQHPGEALHPSMPDHAISDDHVDAILTLEEIAEAIVALVAGQSLRGTRRAS